MRYCACIAYLLDDSEHFVRSSGVAIGKMGTPASQSTLITYRVR